MYSSRFIGLTSSSVSSNSSSSSDSVLSLGSKLLSSSDVDFLSEKFYYY